MKKDKRIILSFAAPLLAVCVLICFIAAVSNLGGDRVLEEKARLEEALARAAVSCYAIEGAYPPTLDYLVENYGVRINEKHFTVMYELYASNLMPDITVIYNGK